MGTQLSRERSWLRFNQRVLLQTERADIPLLEKVRFLAIFANNMDEFFAARIYQAEDAAREGGEDAREEYRTLLAEAYGYAQQAGGVHEQLRDKLATHAIRLIEPPQLTPIEVAYFGAFLAEEVAPRADLLDPGNLADLSSRALYLAAGGHRLRYLIRLPEGTPRLLAVPGRPSTYVRLGPLIRMRPDLFLPEDLPMYEMRLTRLANLELERADWDDLVQAIETRPEGRPTRLEVESAFPWVEEVTRALDLPPEAVFRLKPPLDHRYLDNLISMSTQSGDTSNLVFPPYRARKLRKFLDDPFKRLDSRDIALYHPLDDYGMVEAFVARAARDPDVDMMRISLYRMGRKNGIADALIEAARRGKDVAVLLEGRARFDELQNLHWNLLFRQAGIRILPLPFGFKAHAKALLVRRRGKSYVHLGTGNYNPANGRLYTDLALFTSNEDLTADAAAFFEALERQEAPQLTLMRFGLNARDEMLNKIRAEARPEGRIIVKLNHLTDPLLLGALKDAANAGARVDLIARSTLTVYDEAFNTRCLIGRFLEHPRIVAFRAGGKWDVWAGSADWMPRNFEDRIELVFPVRDRKIKRAIVRLLEAQLSDDVNGFELKPDGTHEPRWGGAVNSQMMRL